MYGSGQQTWEYSPVYALRSYGYILLHAVPVLLTVASNKVCVHVNCEFFEMDRVNGRQISRLISKYMCV